MRILTLLLCSFVALGENWFISPTGLPTNTGLTYDSPWNIGKVATGAAVAGVSAGDTIWCIGGTYVRPASSSFAFGMSGTAEAPITIRNLPGHKCRLVTPTGVSGYPSIVDVTGNYKRLIGLDTEYLGLQVRDIPGSNPPVNMSHAYRVISGAGNTVADAIIIGGQSVVYATNTDTNTTYKHLATVGIGDSAPDRPHGGFSYVQNTKPSQERLVNNMIFSNRSCNYGLRFRSTTADKTENGVADNNALGDVQCNSYACEDCAGGLDYLEWTRNDWWTGASSYIGRANDAGQGISNNVKVEDNRIAPLQSMTVYGMDSTFSFQRNIIRGRAGTTVYFRNFNAATTGVIDYNEYRGSTCVSTINSGVTTNYRPASSPLFSVWQGLGQDQHSTCINNADPAANWVKVINSDIQPQCYVMVTNWTGATSQVVSLAGCLTQGEPWEALDIYDPTSPIATGTYDGTSISLSLTGTRLYEPDPSTIPDRCWMTSCATCYSDPDWKKGATVASFGTPDRLHQPAIVNNTSGGLVLNRIYYANTLSTWTSSGEECSSLGIRPTYVREQKLFGFIVRRRQYDVPPKRYRWRFNAAAMAAISVTLEYSYSADLREPMRITATGSDEILMDPPPQLTGPIWARWCYDGVRCGLIQKMELP